MGNIRNNTENSLRRKIKAAQALYEWNNEKLAIKLHMSLQSLERRLAHPNKFKLEELIKLEELLHIEILKIG